MSHEMIFTLTAVAESAHIALACRITISQNRGDTSAREPRTYHGRGFSLCAPAPVTTPKFARPVALSCKLGNPRGCQQIMTPVQVLDRTPHSDRKSVV